MTEKKTHTHTNHNASFRSSGWYCICARALSPLLFFIFSLFMWRNLLIGTVPGILIGSMMTTHFLSLWFIQCFLSSIYLSLLTDLTSRVLFFSSSASIEFGIYWLIKRYVSKNCAISLSGWNVTSFISPIGIKCIRSVKDFSTEIKLTQKTPIKHEIKLYTSNKDILHQQLRERNDWYVVSTSICFDYYIHWRIIMDSCLKMTWAVVFEGK